MLQRFQGEGGERALVEVLERNRIVGGDKELASAIAEVGALRQLEPTEILIQEGATDNTVHFIVAGTLSVHVKGSKVAERGARDIVGEIGAIEPAQKRSATLMANDVSVILSLTQDQFVQIADQYQSVWKALAIDLSRRLVERNKFVAKVNDQPNVFVISTVEALDIAQEIQAGLARDDMLITVWTDGVFVVSDYPIEALSGALAEADFAVAIAHPDDETQERGETQRTPRDNVIFELGFFMGKLGKERTMLVEPRGAGVKLPSDLTGLTTIGYQPGPADKLAALLGPVCTHIRRQVKRLGPR